MISSESKQNPTGGVTVLEPDVSSFESTGVISADVFSQS
jgi:hypothetical protein